MREYPDSSRDLHAIVHPYLFVLKEGLDIQADFLDYSLLMLRVSPPEVIHSPGSRRTTHFMPASLLFSEQLPSANRPSPPSDLPFE